MNYLEKYEAWLNDSAIDEETKKELNSIKENKEEIQDRFYKDLEFGTAGLRGVIGNGSNRMNKYTVTKATQGLANYINEHNPENKPVAISYDSRHMSKEFSDFAALCLNANGIKTYVFENLRPVPELSFTVRKLNCIAGIMITASHNPPKYNGYKVYWEDGAQIVPPHDKGIIEEVNKITDFGEIKNIEKEEAVNKGLYNVIGKEMDDAYISTLKSLVLNQEAITRMQDKVNIVYTPLHGAGNVPVQRILKELGEKSTFLRNIRYTLIGFFFSSITPAASGGQPMEIYYMHKEKIAVANSTLALLVHLTSFQIVTITLGVLSTILHFEIVKSGLIYLVVLGILLNSTALTLLAISIFSKRLSKGLINFAVKVLRFFRIPNIEKKQESLEKELEKYQESAVYIKEHKKLMIKTLVTTFIQVIIYYSIPYWVYLAFGFTGYNFFQIVTLQAMLYATVSGIPSPGAVGVSEGAFIEIFKGVFPATMMNSAILLNRGASFYLFVIISAIITTITALKTKNYEVKEELNNN